MVGSPRNHEIENKKSVGSISKFKGGGIREWLGLGITFQSVERYMIGANQRKPAGPPSMLYWELRPPFPHCLLLSTSGPLSLSSRLHFSMAPGL